LVERGLLYIGTQPVGGGRGAFLHHDLFKFAAQLVFSVRRLGVDMWSFATWLVLGSYYAGECRDYAA